MTQQNMNQVNPPAPKKSRKKLYGIIGAVIIIIIIIAAIASMGGNHGNQGTSPQPLIIAQSGSVYSLSAGQYEEFQFTTSSGGTLTGTFSVSGGSATAYVLTPSEYANYSSSAGLTSYLYTTGQVTSGAFNTNLGPGTYYIVIQNDNLLLSISVQITNPIELTP